MNKDYVKSKNVIDIEHELKNALNMNWEPSKVTRIAFYKGKKISQRKWFCI